VYFEINKFDIKPESFGLLDEVAQILKDHPELTRIRIEGHTDARGNDAANLALSKGRAKAVTDYLIAKGIDASRLESEGYGETRPLVKANNEAAWAKNRRVDFKVVARSDGK
jgi:outer membrane protein OmpA-like peptidoglycan-associated protein